MNPNPKLKLKLIKISAKKANLETQIDDKIQALYLLQMLERDIISLLKKTK